MIRLAQPDLAPADLAAVTEVLRTGLLVQGARVAAFEHAVARVAGTEHVVAVSSGSAALQLSFRALGLQPGDEVALPACGWPAAANAVIAAGAEPVFIDVDPVFWSLDPGALAEVMRERPRLRAVVSADPFGGMADLPALTRVAGGLPLIEDVGSSIGATLDTRPAGSWGKLGCFSFHQRMIVTTGEGGAVATADEGIAHQCRMLRNHGMEPMARAPDFVEPGFNLRLTELQAALGLSQVERLPAIVAQRREIAGWYQAELGGQGLALPAEREPESQVYQSYVVMLPPAMAPARGPVMARLREVGVETAVPAHHLPLTRHLRPRGRWARGQFPVTDSIVDRAIALPMHTGLRRPDVQEVCRGLRQALAELPPGMRHP
jgi:perosamine synthetase